MITIILDGRYLVVSGVILNVIGMLTVLVTDPGNASDDFWHYMLYLLILFGTGLVMLGIFIVW